MSKKNVVIDSYSTPARKYAKGIGKAVADRTINRKIKREFALPEIHKLSVNRDDTVALDQVVKEYCLSNGLISKSFNVTSGDTNQLDIDIIVSGRIETEEWSDVARRVAIGNTLLDPKNQVPEFHRLHHHIRQASILMSGRHLQHGDETQPSRNQEVFTNCSTSATSFLTFLLLLNGSGVGRAYDDGMCVVDWRYMPIVVPVIEKNHPDCLTGEINILDRREAEHLYYGSNIEIYNVDDSREGWAKAVEKIEIMAYSKKHSYTVLIMDFSNVRCKGSPIAGMQGRPASGPGTLIEAIKKVAQVRNTNMEPWRQAMYIDHYMAECVLVGGARRAARMSTKRWTDPGIFDFIKVKRGGFLWSSNNSVTVDDEFWRYVKMSQEEVKDMFDPDNSEKMQEYERWKWANQVLEEICQASYHDGTGEPGLINQSKLTENNTGLHTLKNGDYARSKKYRLEKDTLPLMKHLAEAFEQSEYKMITNPCGEITLIALGGYCVIADVVPYFAATDDDAEDAFRAAARALIRVNKMDCIYRKEVNRTNRIGVGITGLHEYAWKRFHYGFRDLIDEEKSKDFWMMLSRFKRAVDEEAVNYSAELGMVRPHTNSTIKPAGTVSKLFSLTEGAHLPTMREYLRWVQFRNGDPLVQGYQAKGYPVRHLKVYSGTTIVGFPTQPEICKLGMGDKLVTAAEATPEEQYQYLRLLEKYWIHGVDEDGNPLEVETGNQVSYTLKYDPSKVDYENFKQTLIEGQSTIRCCSVMPQIDSTTYEYQPEQPISKFEYEKICNALKDQEAQEDIGKEHVDCESGACPIDFRSEKI